MKGSQGQIIKMNGKKLSQFQFYFEGLLGTSTKLKQETKKKFLVLESGKFLEALGSKIGTGSVFCHSFSFWDNVF